MQSYANPAFKAEAEALLRPEQISWEAYQDSRKAPEARKTGPRIRRPGP